jgi:gliding motility-associated lipoprotein GldH
MIIIGKQTFFNKCRPEAGRLKPEVSKKNKIPASGFRLLAYVILFSALSSCNPNKIFEEHHKLENYSWNYFQKINFEFNIEEEGLDYDIYIAIRFVDGVPYHVIKSAIQLQFPDGQERYRDINLSIRNKDGSYKGSVAGDIWDCEIPVLKNYPLSQKGKYTLILHNMRNKLETPGIMEIGLILETAE